MMRFRIAALLWVLVPSAAWAEPFTHYVLALSWNPSWCAIEGDGRDAPQCAARRSLGFTLHGLWPQGEDDWPSYCRTTARDPSRRMSAAMADIMGSSGLAWHQWKKHGRCSGLDGGAYYALSRRAYESIERPAVLRALERTVRVDPDVIEEAFLEANPALGPDGVAVTCKDGHVLEVRVCLNRDLTPRSCTAQTARGCRAKSATFPPMR